MSERPGIGATDPVTARAGNQSGHPGLNGCAVGCLGYLAFAIFSIHLMGDPPPPVVVFKNRSSRPVRVESVEKSWANGVAGSKIKRLGVVNAYATVRFTIARGGTYYRLRLRDPAGKLLAGRAVLREDLDHEGKRTTWQVEWDGTHWIR